MSPDNPVGSYPHASTAVASGQEVSFILQNAGMIVVQEILVSTTVDARNSPTSILSAGLVLGQVTASKKWVNYSASASDGSEVPRGPLLHGVNMMGVAASVVDKPGMILLGGTLLLNDNNVAGIDAYARDVFNAHGIMFSDEIAEATQFDPSEFISDLHEIDSDSLDNVETLIAAVQNPTGMLIRQCFGIVSEQFGGGTQDQGIFTLKDTAGTTLGITLTPSDGGVDALLDVVQGINCLNAATGSPLVYVPAKLGVNVHCTQITEGSSLGGKLKVCCTGIRWCGLVWIVAVKPSSLETRHKTNLAA